MQDMGSMKEGTLMLRTQDRRHVLIVEDKADARKALTGALEREGYLVIPTASGRQAFDYLIRNPAPHLIVLDAGMPEMDGIHTLHRLKRHLVLRYVPVAILAAVDDPLARSLGAEFQLCEPDAGEVTRLARQVCG